MAFQYRCPACHYLVEKGRLFGQGCPICGWVSPLGMTGELNAEENSLHVDIVEDDDTIRITTELPLADQNGIKLDVDGNKLLIFSGRFNRIILLHTSVEQIIEKTYRNGVLEVKLRKTGR
jgi:HSP20 family molecular chaperone IbpA